MVQINQFCVTADVTFQAEMVDKQAVSVCGQYQLDVDVNSIVFWHHHLFSQEHVHASQLTRLYDDYVSRMRKNTVQFLTGKVSFLTAYSRECSLYEIPRLCRKFGERARFYSLVHLRGMLSPPTFVTKPLLQLLKRN